MPLHMRHARARRAERDRDNWYRIRNVTGSAAAVHLYDEIGLYGITAADFVRDLSGLDVDSIDLYVNSPGGEIFDGIAIMNCLRSHRARVTVQIDGLAASIASVIAMAGDRIIMAPHSQMMIHDGSGLCVGDAADMRAMAELLDKQSENIAAVYAERAGGTKAQWRKRMQEETWYTAAEAVEAGLADEVAKPRRMPPDEDGMPMTAAWDLSMFRYQGRSHAPAPDASAPVDTASGVHHTDTDTDTDRVDVEVRIPAHLNGTSEPRDQATPELSDWDPDLFRSGMARAAGQLTDWDPGLFRDAVTAQANTAPAATAPATAPEVPAQQRGWAPAPEPEPMPELSMADIFRAALRTEANNAPAPTTTPPATEPEPDYYDPTVVTRALKEASR